MSQTLAYYQTLMHREATLISFGLALVFVFQVVVFRWAERSHLVTGMYFVSTIAIVGGPLAAAVVEAPDRVFNIDDREVIWTFLSFFMTVAGIAVSSPPRPDGARL